MNKNIFYIWKKKQKTLTLNKIPKRNLFFKYLETSKYECIRTDFLKGKFYFKFKIEEHYCSKFTIYDNKLNNYNYDYLTLNTSEYESKTSEFIGKIPYKGELKNQYLNYNYQILTSNKIDKVFTKTTNKNELNKANEIHDLLVSSNKIPIVEEKLNQGFEFFNKCIKYSQKVDDCYQTLVMDYGNDAMIIAKIFFHNYI